MKFLIYILMLNATSVLSNDLLERRALPYRVVMNQFDSTIAPGSAHVRIVCKDLDLSGAPAVNARLILEDVDEPFLADSLGRIDAVIEPEELHMLVRSPGYQSVTIDLLEIKDQHYVEILVNLRRKDMPMKKPAIYLYADSVLETDLRVFPKGKFTFTYPKYQDKWSVTVSPSGLIYVDNKPYNYLFWEGERTTWSIGDKGFIVQSDSLVYFLEEKLDYIGFNQKEINDFIVYWVPILKQNPLNQIYFVLDEEYNTTIASFETDIPVQSAIRLFMAYAPVSSNINVTPQILKKHERKGFTLIEWGGGEAFKETQVLNP